MTTNNIPYAVRRSEITIGKLTLRVHHLNDGRRVIDAQSLSDFFAALEDGSIGLSPEEADALASAVRL